MMMVGRASTNRGSRKFNKKVHVLPAPAGAYAIHIDWAGESLSMS
jgi:hypothetical protein